MREVIAKFRRDGLFSTINAVRGRLDQPTALGYSSAGTVIAIADDVHDIQVGDRVACAGAGYAVHAEFACVPRLLVATLPSEAVTFDEAAFATVGAVALHGIRTAEVKLGDVVAVIGLGLLGQLTVQLLRAAGCHVLGLDLRQERAALAVQGGAVDASHVAEHFSALCSLHSSGRGVDAVLITAETSSSDPVNLAARVARDRGVIVAVGTVGMDLQRKLYYEKELDFRISRSYGPGRYDACYEQKGRDYPIGYVRWTETRNMEAFLRLVADHKIAVRSLVTHRYGIEDAQHAYSLIASSTSNALGVLITYSSEARPTQRLTLVPSSRKAESSDVRVGVLGAGNFASSILIPAIKRERASGLIGVCAATGAHSRAAARKFGFRYCTANEDEIFSDPAITAVVIATRHHLHAGQVASALKAGKHVFCEKPLCLTESELMDLISLYRDLHSAPLLMVGFNRRFAPMTRQIHQFLSTIREPLTLHYRVNAGPLAADHWINDSEQGGGRIIGEVCHFIDLLSFLTNSEPREVETRTVGKSDQDFIVSLRFANGSHGTITYVTSGDRSFSKERLEVFGGGCAAVLEDFRHLEMIGYGRRSAQRSRLRQDKGHEAEWQAFTRAIQQGGPSPIPFEQIVASTLAALRAVDSRSLGKSLVVERQTLCPATPDLCDSSRGALKVESC